MLVAPRTHSLTSIITDSIWSGDVVFQEEFLKDYDDRLGACENPDPNIFAILLLLSKQLPFSVVNQLHDLNLQLKNPWLKLAARVIARLDIPDGSVMNMGSFHDHRVHNMIAALSLRRYAEAQRIQYPESLLLASFLESRELAVSSLALGYYVQTILSYLTLRCHLISSLALYVPRLTSYCLIINSRWDGKFWICLSMGLTDSQPNGDEPSPKHA